MVFNLTNKPSLELNLQIITKNTQNSAGPPLAKQMGPGGWLQEDCGLNLHWAGTSYIYTAKDSVSKSSASN